MRKLLLITFVFFISNTLFSQEIEGLGFFKINKTTIEETKNYFKENKIKIETIKDWRAENRIITGSGLRRETAGIIHPGIDVIYRPECYEMVKIIIKKLTIADTDFNNLELDYYNDVLVKIKANSNNDYYEALTKKYGNALKEYNSVEYTCVYNITGVERTLEGYSNKTVWGDKIIVEAKDVKKYGSTCRGILMSYFEIYEKAKYESIIINCKKNIIENVNNVDMNLI